VALSEQLRPI